MKINKRSGSTVLTMPFVIIFSLILIITLGVFIVNMILPFVWYQKLQNISYKYMYVVEKYGYLTISEKESLIEELSSQGFDRKEVIIRAPTEPASYGSLIEFSICYNYKQKLPSWKGSFKMITKNIPININKVIISKM